MNNNIKNGNKKFVLNIVKERQPLSRTQIGQLTGMRLASIGKYVQELIQQGWLIEENRNPYSRRPRNTMLGINPEKGFFVGIEFDPEWIIGVVTDMRGNIRKKIKRDTHSDKGKDVIIGNLISAIKELILGLEQKKIIGIGISAHGIIDTEKGICIFYVQIKDWKNIPLREIIEKKFNLPVVLEGTAPMKAFAEKSLGAGKGVRNLVFIEYGVAGIGAGFILNGQLFGGTTENAGELGHTVLEPEGPICSCGMSGCLEALASESVLATQARRSLEEGTNSLISELSGGNPENITAEMVFEAARRGDNLSLGLVDNAAKYLGIGIANLINLLNPEMVVLDPQFTKVEDLFLLPTKRAIATHTLQRLMKNVRIELSPLGEEIGARGICAYLTEKEMRLC
ncbi:MAG: hypothetical protein COZ37_04110 [bacterium (Candidatus Ratteibacteria) CG_4_10_14_3_um_filter_41_18]|uniref:HTH marR-type domain-containing protein n=4 Tax=Candidatus Ratteibacteria TaxID=2979319 RepID=A0A2M7YI50_9BACT|nr:MAG: hypothetical protein AUJ76_01635 [Candidatus Omnitrophica bacterium CG1_02_41_171]PIV63675.1 MAG: hypothetical protein COS11_06225 [bacterium (Candidatus Ratteibacteria) CG01_land_8_20_14_3_00_40_19]PIW31615.1 MAG: hypothetical protein COW28_07000 [bacterium (Candidatus Ratteibacteria) CG15_BIG_FIL_POST_REV_8_21_14_020_41_12]PIW74225.1 MAG: hypothetical protein CO004_01835 [bacterium (Candidatus Ratteibacteria) CG_4_8_14_3_um_filter_41_36]PIX77170.1 MAG: hypothetical protein COZ37_04110